MKHSRFRKTIGAIGSLFFVISFQTTAQNSMKSKEEGGPIPSGGPPPIHTPTCPAPQSPLSSSGSPSTKKTQPLNTSQSAPGSSRIVVQTIWEVPVAGRINYSVHVGLQNVSTNALQVLPPGITLTVYDARQSENANEQWDPALPKGTFNLVQHYPAPQQTAQLSQSLLPSSTVMLTPAPWQVTDLEWRKRPRLFVTATGPDANLSLLESTKCEIDFGARRERRKLGVEKPQMPPSLK